MNLKDMSATVAAAKSTFIPITVKSKDDNIICLREYLTPTLLGITYNTSGGAHNLWRILSTDAAYSTRNNTAFLLPIKPTVYPNTMDDATYVVHSLSKTVHKSL